MRFYTNIRPKFDLPAGVDVINIYKERSVHKSLEIFFVKYFSDTNKRILVLGINPGRFGSGVTGIPFTDPEMLSEKCGIKNQFPRRQELTSRFVYAFIDKFGGAKAFYDKFFLSAVSPLGFTKNARNYNYYDDKDFLKKLKPFIISSLKQHKDFGVADVVILLGAGKNTTIFKEINNETKLFKHVLALEHPRFVMQYRRDDMSAYIQKYEKVFNHALSLSKKKSTDTL